MNISTHVTEFKKKKTETEIYANTGVDTGITYNTLGSIDLASERLL